MRRRTRVLLITRPRRSVLTLHTIDNTSSGELWLASNT